MGVTGVLLLVFLIGCVPAFAQAPEPASPLKRPVTEADFEAIRSTRIVTAIRASESIVLDGRLNEPSWKAAVPATDFYQRVPRNGEAATERTEVRFVYDEDNLYVGVTAFDPEPWRQVIKELKEDFDINGADMVQLVLDSLHDGRTGFAFSVNPVGARRDAQFANGQANNDWDAVWDVKTSSSEEAWYIEYEIPFKTLRFSTEADQDWGVQISRRVPRHNEESNWAPLQVRFQATRISSAGTLRGLQNLRQGRNLKVKPYILAESTETRLDGLLTRIDSLGALDGYNAGFDVKYSLTPSMTLDTTFRTDFAQVEADQQQVNLTRFNLFFPEKRDFFLENAGTFTFGANPQGNNQVSSGTGSNNNNNNQTNLVPFFSRRIGLSAAGTPVPIIGGARVTGRTGAYDVGVIAMKTDDQGLTPSNAYLVGRVKRNFLTNSWFGALVTSRDSTVAGDYNRVFGPDFHLQLFNRIDIDSYYLKSQTSGPGGKLDGKDQARRFLATYRDDEINASAEYHAVETNFIPDVGFVRRPNMSQYSGELGWFPQIDRSDQIRNLIFGGSVDYFNSGTTGDIETRTQEARTGVQFNNNGNATFIFNQTFDRLVEPFDIRSDVSIPAGDYDYRSYRVEGNIGNSRKVLMGGSYGWGEFFDGTNDAITSNMSLRLNHHWSVDLNYTRNHVTLPADTFTTQLFGARFLVAFNAKSFVNAFFQYNTDTRQISSNIRFNVTHHPLSDLYVVYNDTRDTGRGQIAGRALMVKLTNLFNF